MSHEMDIRAELERCKNERVSLASVSGERCNHGDVSLCFLWQRSGISFLAHTLL